MSSVRDRLLLVPLALLMALIVLVAARTGLDARPEGSSNDSPDACMTRLLDAETKGNHLLYLECFESAERSKVEVTWRGKSDSDIAAELRGHQADVVGHAITGLQMTQPDRAELVLERIYKDHTSRQQVSLIRVRNRWQIIERLTPDRQTPTIPYGTPVFTPQ